MGNKLKVAIATVGCRANQADSARLLEGFDAAVIELVDDGAQADVAIVNTCCVTKEAERDCRKAARRFITANPDGRVLVFGCAVNAALELGPELEGRVERISREGGEPEALARALNEHAGSASPSAPSCSLSRWEFGRSRALLKIQNGCNHFCSYCIVPKARGKERSTPRLEVIERARRLVDEGFGEIVLSGVQLGAWGSDQPGKPPFAQLVADVAEAIGAVRLRLSSIEPWSVDEALARVLAAHGNICAHLHVPLQSGDDGVLEAMRRGYTRDEYLERIAVVRELLPEIAIGTDVLVGFPGEGESAFANTLRTLEELRPAYVHAFPYSSRPGTRAAEMEGRVERAVAKQRVRLVRERAEAWMADYRRSQLETVRTVLVEQTGDGGATGVTDTFVPIHIPGYRGPAGTLVRVAIAGEPTAKRLIGRALSS